KKFVKIAKICDVSMTKILEEISKKSSTELEDYFIKSIEINNEDIVDINISNGWFIAIDLKKLMKKEHKEIIDLEKPELVNFYYCSGSINLFSMDRINNMNIYNSESSSLLHLIEKKDVTTHRESIEFCEITNYLTNELDIFSDR
ncbi:MAG: hypothetical protein MHPSP_003184, partial [Paramarteilia canceri]